MNKVTTVNLNGNAFQLEESGYEALRAYLDAAAAKLAGNPDQGEIISDIEQAIADKFRAVLGAYKTVVTTQQVEAVIAEMGPVDGGDADAGAAAAGAVPVGGTHEGAESSGRSPGGTPTTRRLHRLYDGAIFAGVCNGLAAYFNIDPTIVRILFVILTIVTTGAWALVYLVMMFVVPAADTPAQRTAAHGATSTAQEFIRRAREGYYEGTRKFSDKEARREWKRRFRREMHGWRSSFQAEMQAGAQQWQSYWSQYPGVSAAWSFLAPVMTVAHAALAFVLLASLLSLLTTSALFGFALPTEIPVWGGVVIVFIAYAIVVVPIKLARHLYWRQVAYGGHPGVAAVVHMWDALIWLAFVIVVGLWAFRHMPLVMQALHSVPGHFHAAVDAIREWWSR